MIELFALLLSVYSIWLTKKSMRRIYYEEVKVERWFALPMPYDSTLWRLKLRNMGIDLHDVRYYLEVRKTDRHLSAVTLAEHSIDNDIRTDAKWAEMFHQLPESILLHEISKIKHGESFELSV